MLLAKCPKVDVLNEDGESALHYAGKPIALVPLRPPLPLTHAQNDKAAAGHLNCVQTLLEAGAGAMLADSKGRLPLIGAIRGHHNAIARLLLSLDSVG